jgi:hypothetical protein
MVENLLKGSPQNYVIRLFVFRGNKNIQAILATGV